MIKVGISGANGTMGRLTIATIDAVGDLTIGGLYAPGRDGLAVCVHSLIGSDLELFVSLAVLPQPPHKFLVMVYLY